MDAARLGGETISKIYKAQDLPTSQPIKEMIKGKILHDYEVQKAGIHLNSHINDVIIAHNAVTSTSPSFGGMSNFLGATSATTTDPDINKLVESAFAKHHLVEKMAHVKELEQNAEAKDTEAAPIDIDKMVADSFEKHHLT
jgi:hypothetical protein